MQNTFILRITVEDENIIYKKQFNGIEVRDTKNKIQMIC
jgi:hypothetical protein